MVTIEIKPRKSNAGRKWFDGKNEKDVIAKLEEATAIDASVEECLFYADISRDGYYRYLKAHPDFAIRLSKLRENPVMLARKTAIAKLPESYSNAMDYLKRKRKAEFGDSSEIMVRTPKPIDDVLQDVGIQENKITEETN